MLVSICVTIYNVSAYIERCAHSVFGQTYQDLETIFVNDGSTDNSVKILERILLEYPDMKNKVQIIHHEHNRGLAAARNTAVAAAKGEFIIHVDSDDWLERDTVEALVNRQQETDADIVSGNALRHTPKGEKLLIEPQYQDNRDMTMHMLEMNLNHSLWRRLIRRSLYAEHDIHAIEGINIGEDHLVMSKLAYYAKTIAHTDKVVYHYNCMNEASYMTSRKRHTFNLQSYQSNIAVLNALTDFFQDKDATFIHKLKTVNHEHQDYQGYMSLRYGTWQDYTLVCRDMNNSLMLPFFCLRHVWREIRRHYYN